MALKKYLIFFYFLYLSFFLIQKYSYQVLFTELKLKMKLYGIEKNLKIMILLYKKAK